MLTAVKSFRIMNGSMKRYGGDITQRETVLYRLLIGTFGVKNVRINEMMCLADES